uniref:Uncharacterized protein n=1 Tax=Panagrolaimus davidi TaxID=227884 RepID=A0A914R2J0_9BILA
MNNPTLPPWHPLYVKYFRKYYYVKLVDENGECGETRPRDGEKKDKLSGALYLNQKYAKYAYFVYQSFDFKTCILTIEFEDLFQGDYSTGKPVPIKPKKVNVIENEVDNYFYPFFTIDAIMGTMVYLTKTGDKLAAVHYKIDESNLTNVKYTFHIPLKTGWWDKYRGMIWVLQSDKNLFHKSPSFTSYGTATFLFSAKTPNYPGITGFWFMKSQPAYNTQLLKHDNQRHFFYLNPAYFEKDREYRPKELGFFDKIDQKPKFLPCKLFFEVQFAQ